MQNSKKIVLSLLLAMVILLILSKALYILIIPDYAVFNKLMMDEVYNGEDSDIVFLGSSKTYTTICPEVVWNEIGMSAFDLCTSGQGTMGGYYLLQEYYRYHTPPKYVVIEMQENRLLGYEADQKGKAASNFQITDVIRKTSPVFWKYFYNAYSVDNYFSAFFPLSHYRSNFTFGFSLNRLLSGDAYKIATHKWMGAYKGKGYIAKDTRNGDDVDRTIIDYEESILPEGGQLCEESVKYFEKTLELCYENGSKVIIVTYPGIDNSLALNRMQECNDFYEKLCDKYELDYINMMFSKDYSKIKDDANDFIDEGHMNDLGARKHTDVLCKILQKVILGKEYDSEFYTTAEEWKQSRMGLLAE